MPAYVATQSEQGLREKLLALLLRGVSTRNYQDVLPGMADRCGVSRSAVSRQFHEASAEALRRLCERRFEGVELLIIYIGGKDFGGHQVVSAEGATSCPILSRPRAAVQRESFMADQDTGVHSTRYLLAAELSQRPLNVISQDLTNSLTSIQRLRLRM